MNKKTIVAIVAVLLCAALLAGVYFLFREKPVEGSKSITIEVIDSTGASKVYEVKTDAQYLHGAMEDAKGLEFSGTEDQYGLTLLTVNGETVDFSTAYWGLFVNEGYCNYGIDSQPVEDGDAFQIVYTEL